MKTINYKLPCIFLMLITFFFSCNTNEISLEESAIQESTIELKSKYKLLDFTPNIYHDYFKQTTYSVGFSSLKSNPLSEHSIVQRISSKEDEKSPSVLINDKKIISLSKANKISKIDSQNIYGKTVRFIVNRGNNSAKSSNTSSEESEIEMYVPDLLEITNPKIISEKDLFPICYYKDFVLEWNADPNNKEGLVVIAEYFGNNAIPKNDTGEHILNTDIIDTDDGHAVLNNALFKDMPNLSIVHLVLLRGNVVIEEITGESYKFFAESHVRLPIVLLKDVTTISNK